MQSIRQDFPALSHYAYLNTAGIGLTPQPVTAEIQRLFGEWSARGATTPTFRDELRQLAAAARERAADVFAADPDELAFTGRVAESLHIVVDGLTWRRGDEIIISDEEVLYTPIYRIAKDYGVVVKRMHFDHDRDALLNRFDDLLTSRTRFVWFSDTTNKSGIHIPAREICSLAHSKDALVMFDGAQTAGQFPMDLHGIGCDFYAITGYKWLLGPYGCGLCYIRKDLIPLVRALRVGQGAVDHDRCDYTESETAMRYDFGVRNQILRIGFGKTLEYLAELGFERIRARIADLRCYLLDGLVMIAGIAVGSPRDPDISSGVVCISLKDSEPSYVVDRAWQAGIVVVPQDGTRERPELRGVRVSPSFYNTQEDIDRLLETLDSLTP